MFWFVCIYCLNVCPAGVLKSLFSTYILLFCSSLLALFKIVWFCSHEMDVHSLKIYREII